MLVLTRKVDEEIIIDGRISVRLLDIQGGRVRIGITAPDDVSIRRAELVRAFADEPRPQRSATVRETPLAAAVRT